MNEEDDFAPPAVPVLLWCIHCERFLSSREMRFDGRQEIWCCGFEGCDGAGVGIDLWQVNTLHERIVRDGDGDQLLEWRAAVFQLLERIGGVDELHADLEIMRRNHPLWYAELPAEKLTSGQCGSEVIRQIRQRFDNPRLRADGTIGPT